MSSSPRDKPASLGALLASSRDAAARLAGTAIDREQWRRVVGERIAMRTEPGPKRGRELLVYVASASWAQELSLLVTEIVARLRQAGVGVDTVRFQVRAIRAAVTAATARKPAHERAPIPSALQERLESIMDLELRSAIAEAASSWLALDSPRADAAPSTSRPPAARNPRGAESRSVRSGRTSRPEPAGRKGKP